MASRSLGTLSIDLVAKLGGFTKGMDQGERRMAAFGKKIDKFNRDAGRAFSIAGAAALGFGAVVIANTIEAEKVQAQLAAALKSTAGAAGLTQGQLNDMAGALQRTSTLSDEAINSAQALLLTFTKIGKDVFPEAIEGALDMSAALGTDLQSATQQLGKALNDPLKGISALGRAGVQFTEEQKGMIEALVETGRVADAQRIILGELETQFGGSAAAARDTLGGALEAAKHAFGDLLEGDNGSDGIRGAKEAIESFTATMQSDDTKRGFQAMVEGMASMAKMAAETIAMIGGIGAAINNAFTAVDQKTFEGLIQEQMSLEDRINAAKKPRALVTGFLPQRAREDVALLERQLADVIRRQDEVLARGRQQTAQLVTSARALGVPMLSGGNEVIRPDAADAGEWGMAPRGGSEGRRVPDAESLSDYLLGLQKVGREETEQRDRWKEMVAQLSGPLAEAQYDHEKRLEAIKDAGLEAGASSGAIAEALRLETAAHEKNVEAIKAAGDPLGQLLADMKWEYDLLGLSNAERITENELRRLGIDLTTEEAAAAREAIRARVESHEALKEQISALDNFRDSFEDNVASVLDGSESIKEAIKDMVDDFLAQMARAAAKNIAASLFGESGQAGGGSLGSLIGNVFSMFSGDTDAGPYKAILPGKLTSDFMQFPRTQEPRLISGSGPGKRGWDAPRVIEQNITVQGSASKRSLERMRIDLSRQMREARSRTA